MLVAALGHKALKSWNQHPGERLVDAAVVQSHRQGWGAWGHTPTAWHVLLYRRGPVRCHLKLGFLDSASAADTSVLLCLKSPTCHQYPEGSMNHNSAPPDQ